MLSRFRRQLPAYSPLPAGAIGAAAARLVAGTDPRAGLASLLLDAYSARDVRLCGSGAQALQLALRLARDAVGPRARVALPAYSCYEVASAAIGADCRVSLYDLDPETLSPDPDSLERVLRAGARVVVVAPLFGIPVDRDRLTELCARHGALLVEDAAQGHGALWRGRALGTLDAVSVLSFGRGKGWTGASGGAVLLRDLPGAASAPLEDPGSRAEVSAALAACALSALGRPTLFGLPAAIPGIGIGETRFHPPTPVRGMTRMAAALLASTRDESLREAAVRRASAADLLAELDGLAGVVAIRCPGGAEPGFIRLPLRVVRPGSARAVATGLRRLGVAPGYPSTLALPELRDRLEGPELRWPGAEQLVREVITLPTHSRVAAGERALLVRGLQAFVRGPGGRSTPERPARGALPPSVAPAPQYRGGESGVQGRNASRREA